MTNQASMTVFNTPGQLDARLEHLAVDRYHLFINGRWTYAYYETSLLMDAYHEFHRQGHACTVVAAGEIFFYSRRQVHYTQEHPFCDDIDCTCHEDMDLIFIALMVPYDQGWLTTDEAVRIYLDEHISRRGKHQKITI